jgi:epoxyqueuosine reductase
MLINSQAGSYFFLGEILTDLPLPLTAPQETTHCGTCTACLDLCPTQAFVAPQQLNASRCISYLTIELRGSIPLELRKKIGNRIFGCDDCQAVCPWNKFAQRTEQEVFQPKHNLDDAQLTALFAWSEEEYLEKTAGSALRRIGYEGWLRNIAVALGNARTTSEIIFALNSRREHESVLVREHVAWALEQHAH